MHTTSTQPLPEDDQPISVDHEIAFFKSLCDEIASGTVELPTFPEVALKIRKALSNPDCSVEKVARIVVTEPMLSASLIQVANSAAFSPGSNKTVTDLKAAITRVGFDIARNIAISIAIKQAFNPKQANHLRAQMERLWQHSLRVAAIAYVLPNKPQHISPDEAMLAGLVHDIGKFYILVQVDKNPDLFPNKNSVQKLSKLWSSGIGKLILESWGFSKEIVTAADEHETLDQHEARSANMTDVVIVSNLLSYIGQSDSPYKDIDYSNLPSFKHLNLDLGLITKIMSASKQQISAMMQALK